MRCLILSAALLSAGCASTPQVRDLADRTGLFVTSLQGGTGEFVELQSRLNAGNAARLDRLVALGSPDRANARQQRVAWTDAGNMTRLATHDAASEVSAEEIVAGLELNATTAARPTAPALEGYGKSLKALADVSTKPKSTLALRELLEFGREVYGKYGELQEKADKAAESTAPAAAAVDTQAQAAAASVPQ